MRLFYNEGQENQGWGYGLYLNQGQSELKTQGWNLHCGGKAGVINDHGAPIAVDLDRCVFTQGSVTTAWAMKLFEVSGILKNCTFMGIGDNALLGGSARDGHPVYFSPTGDVMFISNSYLGNAGNCQFVQRDYGYPHSKTGLPVVDKAPEGPTQLGWYDCLFQNGSWNPAGGGGGGAAQIAAYNATEYGTAVRVHSSSFVNNIPYRSKEWGRHNAAPRGAITLWNECWEALVAGTSKIGLTEPNADKYFSLFEMAGTSHRTTRPDRSYIDIKGTKEVSVQDWTFDTIGEYQDSWPFVIDIDKNASNPQRATRIEIEPASSGVGNIRHTLPSGERVIKSITEGYSWSA